MDRTTRNDDDDEFLNSKGFSDEEAGEVYAIGSLLIKTLTENRIRPSELVIGALELMLKNLKRDLRS